MTHPDDADRPLRFGEPQRADDDRVGRSEERTLQWGRQSRRDEPAPQPAAWTGDDAWGGSSPSGPGPTGQQGQQGRWGTDPGRPALGPQVPTATGDDGPREGGLHGGLVAGLGTREGIAGLLFAVGWVVAALGVVAALAALTITETGAGFVIESFARDLVLGLGLGGVCLALSQLLRPASASAGSDDGTPDAASSSSKGPDRDATA